jgi:ELWxxDGT repeat protein
MSEALIFFGVSAAGNNTVWKSDGTTAGTVPIIDVDLGVNTGMDGGSYPTLLDYANTILAQGYKDLGGPNQESALWIYNKSTSTYTPYKYEPNNPSFSPGDFVEYKGTVYFNGGVIGQGWSSYPPYELFATDGTAEGTIRITTSNLLYPSSLAVAFNKLFFAGTGSSPPWKILYSYDGGSALPVPAGVDVPNPSSLAVAFVGTVYALPNPDLPFGHRPQPPLFMSGYDSSGTWLYQYDGSSVTKIVPWTALSPTLASGLAPYNLVNLGWAQTWKAGPFDLESWHRALCFSGVNASGAREVWISLGTSETTTQIPMPSVPGLTSHYPYNLTPFNGMLYFTAYDTAAADGRGLFVYDPVANETRQIIESSAYDLNSGNWQDGSDAVNHYTMAVFDNKLYFNATEPRGKPSLWRIDGAPTFGQATPQLVSSGGDNGLNPFSLTTANF